jgi:signal transduction histidine kinase
LAVKDHSRFFVKDSGIESQNRNKSHFDRFRQAEGTSSFSHEGSGLGLAISKAYIEVLGGKIWVKKEMAAHFILRYPISI